MLSKTSVVTGQVILYLVCKISVISLISSEIICYVVSKISLVTREFISYLILEISVASVVSDEIIFM